MDTNERLERIERQLGAVLSIVGALADAFEQYRHLLPDPESIVGRAATFRARRQEKRNGRTIDTTGLPGFGLGVVQHDGSGE